MGANDADGEGRAPCGRGSSGGGRNLHLDLRRLRRTPAKIEVALVEIGGDGARGGREGEVEADGVQRNGEGVPLL